MKKIPIIFSLLFFSLFAKNFCYTIKTEVGIFTPAYPDNIYSKKTCRLKELPLDFDNNGTYIGCFKYKKDALYRYNYLKKSGFHFKNEKIIKIHPTSHTKFIIFPYFAKSTQEKLQRYKKYFIKRLNHLSLKNIQKLFPKKFYGNGIDKKSIDKMMLLPTLNIFSFYRYYKQHDINTDMIILYNGVYSLQDIYKKYPKMVKKISASTYLINAPIYIAKNASLVIKNKKILLGTYPKPIFIIYHGKLYTDNSQFITVNSYTLKYEPRENIKKESLLLVGKQKPRPYFLGLSNSFTIMLDSTFKGLGFHDITATFGISLAQIPSIFFHNSALMSYIKVKKPQGIFVGNEIYNNMMGFYSANAQNVDIVGNYIHNNVIYGIDPHDYSKNLLIARNLVSNAKYAHGIIISRGVNKTFIAQNMVLKNHSNGIMLDRLCPDNLIYDNFSIANGIAGISFQESNNNAIIKNTTAYNFTDGTIIRNSLNTLIQKNKIFYNGKNGVEIITKNIDNTIYRNFSRDPYQKATSAVLLENHINNNYLYQINVKNSAALKMKKNIFDKNDINLFGENLQLFMDKIIENKYNFELYGTGNMFRAISTDKLKIRDKFSDIFIDLSNYNSSSGTILAKIYRYLKLYNLSQYELLREANNLVAKALELYGFYKTKLNEKDKNILVKNISYILEAAIMGNKDATLNISYLKYVWHINQSDIQKAFIMAKKRMLQGEIFTLNDKKNPIVCQFPHFSKKVIQSYIDIFDYKYQKSQAKNINEYFNKLNKNYTLMIPNIFTIMENIYQEKNIPKIRYNNFLITRTKDLNNSLICRRYLQKNIYFKKEINKIIPIVLANNIDKLKPIFRRYLKLINKNFKKYFIYFR